MVVIVCALMGLFSTSAGGAVDSHGVGLAAEAGPQPVLEAGLGVVAIGIALLAPLVLVVLWRRDVIRPGSLDRRPRRDVSAWPWWFWLLCAICTYIVLAIGAGTGLGLAVAIHGDPTELVQNAYMAVAAYIAGIAGGSALLYIVHERIRQPGLSGVSMRIDARGVGLGLIAIALAFPVVQAASIGAVQVFRLVTGEQPDVIAHETLQALQEQPGHPAVWALVLAAVIGAPILEELVFRVYLQSSLVRLLGGIRGGVWGAILVSSLIFTGIHVGAGIAADQWHALVTLFVLSIAIGLAYEWTRRAIVPIVMHMVFNGFNITLVVLGVF